MTAAIARSLTYHGPDIELDRRALLLIDTRAIKPEAWLRDEVTGLARAP